MVEVEMMKSVVVAVVVLLSVKRSVSVEAVMKVSDVVSSIWVMGSEEAMMVEVTVSIETEGSR